MKGESREYIASYQLVSLLFCLVTECVIRSFGTVADRSLAVGEVFEERVAQERRQQQEANDGDRNVPRSRFDPDRTHDRPVFPTEAQPRDGVDVQRDRETQSTEENEGRDRVEYDPPPGDGEKSLQRIEQ